MRYREDAVTGDIGAPTADEGVIVGMAVYALVVGIGMCFFGFRTRIPWLIFMGGTLTIASTVYLGAFVLGYA